MRRVLPVVAGSVAALWAVERVIGGVDSDDFWRACRRVPWWWVMNILVRPVVTLLARAAIVLTLGPHRSSLNLGMPALAARPAVARSRGLRGPDAQILARHADPRTPEHHDRARGSADRSAVRSRASPERATNHMEGL